LFFQRPCEDTRGSEKANLPKLVAGQPILAGAFGGKGGSAPGHREDVKIGARKLAFASAKPTLTVKM
jgi:hypothetical protein